MHEVAAYSTMAMTLGLVVTRPRVGPTLRLSPAVAAIGGALVLALFGAVRGAHVWFAVTELRGPFVGIASIMVMTAVADRVGLLAWWAARLEAGVPSTAALFRRVFVLGALTASMLTNDAAILLLTPIVLTIVRRRFPDRPALLVPFAFAVFASAGVAAVPVANPMNMVVADAAGIDFVTYAARMIPIAVVVAVISYAILARLFARALATPLPPATVSVPAMTAAQRQVMALLAAVLLTYPAAGSAGVPMWTVALAGAGGALALARRHRAVAIARVLTEGISYETLVFLLAVLVMALGLREVGLVDRLAAGYHGGGVWTVGATSALGSAVLNNHPMALMNMLALGRDHDPQVLAALVGGDLGPRLLPMGSLAGLLWLAQIRRHGVEVGAGRFFAIGVATALPTIVVALALLALL